MIRTIVWEGIYLPDAKVRVWSDGVVEESFRSSEWQRHTGVEKKHGLTDLAYARAGLKVSSAGRAKIESLKGKVAAVYYPF